MPIETRVSHDGLVWISGNYYSIPDHTRRIVEVQQLPDVIPFSIKAQSLPSIPFWRRPPANSRRARASTGGQPVQVATWRIRSPRRSGRRSHRQAGRWGFTEVSQTAPPIGRPAITMHAQPAAIDNVRKRCHVRSECWTPRCGELKEGEVTWIEALDHAYRGADGARQSPVSTALRMSRLTTVKTLAGFDFAFQPSLDRNRILELAELKFICLRHRQEPSRDGTRGRGREGGKERRVRHARGHRHHHFARAPAVPRPRLPPCRRRDRLPPGRTWRRQSVLPVGERPL